MTDAIDPIRRIFENVGTMIDGQRWIATGIVSKTRKKDRKIRVKILPELIETNWLRVYYLNAGDNFVTGQMPAKDSEVVCLFIGADPDSAFVIAGGFLDEGDKVPEIEDELAIPIYDKYGNQILLDKDGITIKSTKALNISVETDTKIETKGKTEITSTGDTSIKGANVTVEATNSATVKGIDVTVSGTKSVNINGTIGVTVNNGVMPVARMGDLAATLFGPAPISTVSQVMFKA